ncbi:hypothetical protein GH714_030088 [Hevea brasiliensis]|uniref:Ion transport domain-containing protein n=1 Tax=Hevea brasiliensis TaxID=3981 RepID=A0A6A6NL38_HEVBR|nr:hypothetical protein GH714_030088 [Hevea brasiliensis]
MAMAAKMGSFRYTFAEKRERLLSTKGYSEIGFPNIYEEEYAPRNCCSYRFLCDKIVGFCESVQDVAKKAYEMEPIKELSRYSVWAVLTVVVVFEFSIGFCASYAKLYPTMKPYEYGFRVFFVDILLVMVSGYRTREFIHTAIIRRVNGYLNCVDMKGSLPKSLLIKPLMTHLQWLQAPAERRQVFSQELRRVGAEGAKLLRELGNKVKKMEKLGSVDILYQVHEAAEELQNKVDRKSYLLVNSESWEIGKSAKDLGEPQDLLNFDDEVSVNKVLQHKSHSEAVLNLRSLTIPKSWDGQKPPVKDSKLPLPPAPGLSSDSMFKKQISWPARISFAADALPQVEESKTYESASALSLATFTSLLIEFVARLQNLVDSFEELSEKANFKEPDELLSTGVAEPMGFWTRLLRSMKFWN